MKRNMAGDGKLHYLFKFVGIDLLLLQQCCWNRESSHDIQIGRNVSKMSPGSAVRVMIVHGGRIQYVWIKKGNVDTAHNYLKWEHR